MKQPLGVVDFDNAYSLLNGAEALRLMADTFAEIHDDQPIGRDRRSALIFMLKAVATTADAVATAVVDQEAFPRIKPVESMT